MWERDIGTTPVYTSRFCLAVPRTRTVRVKVVVSKIERAINHPTDLWTIQVVLNWHQFSWIQHSYLSLSPLVLSNNASSLKSSSLPTKPYSLVASASLTSLSQTAHPERSYTVATIKAEEQWGPSCLTRSSPSLETLSQTVCDSPSRLIFNFPLYCCLYVVLLYLLVHVCILYHLCCYILYSDFSFIEKFQVFFFF